MLNNIFPLIVQAGVQAVTETPVAAAFESSTLWIDDVITLYLLGF